MLRMQCLAAGESPRGEIDEASTVSPRRSLILLARPCVALGRGQTPDSAPDPAPAPHPPRLARTRIEWSPEC